MSLIQCVQAGLSIMAAKPLNYLGLSQKDEYYGYYSKSFSRNRNLLPQTGNPRKVILYYHRTLADSPAHACNLSVLGIATQCISYLFGILLLYMTVKKLIVHYSKTIRVMNKNESCQIDKEEVELYTIDSIEEFDRVSKSETSNENIAGSRPNVNRRNIYTCQQDGMDDTDTCDVDDICVSDHPATHPYENDKKVNIYSVVTQRISSIKNMLSHLSPNRSNSTDDEKVNLCSRRQLKDTSKKDSNRKLTIRDSRLEFREHKVESHHKNQIAKKMKDRSVNTEIKTFKMTDAVSFGDADSYTENETDLEKEMVFIDLPANYYYQNRLSTGHPSPCLINFNKNRRKSQRC